MGGATKKQNKEPALGAVLVVVGLSFARGLHLLTFQRYFQAERFAREWSFLVLVLGVIFLVFFFLGGGGLYIFYRLVGVFLLGFYTICGVMFGHFCWPDDFGTF